MLFTNGRIRRPQNEPPRASQAPSLPHTQKRIANEKADHNVLLVGLGPHARRTYVPHLLQHAARFNAHLAAVVELDQARDEVERVCTQHDIAPERVYVPRFPAQRVPDEVRQRLNELVVRSGIDGVIIATEPLSHRAYLDWALHSGLNIVVDKPITTRRDVAHNLVQAQGIYADYREILEAHQHLQRRKRTCLLVNSHRRWHPGFRLVLEMIADIRDRFGQPVTSISSSHCDGQWRLPAEIVTQDYHPYNRGYGKVSHSGYHLLDMVACFLKAGCVGDKAPDTVAITSSFVLPSGFLCQFRHEDYRRVFGLDYDEVCPRSDAELLERVAGFGEIDAKGMLEFRREGVVVVQAQIDLRHNGFARRTWVRPGADLYKGNGRVRHERHEIVSGPFQTVIVESYQASDKHERCGANDVELGGNNHFDVFVFRNCGITGDREAMQRFRLCDIPVTGGFDCERLFNEQIKEACLLELLEFMRGNLRLDQLSSNIDDHELAVRMMSAMYEAHVRRRGSAGPWVEFPLRLEP